MSFDWMDNPTFPRRKNATKTTREDEIEHRAFLLAKLGFTKKRAQERLTQNLNWEYERIGKAVVQKRLNNLVNSAYIRAGVSKKKP